MPESLNPSFVQNALDTAWLGRTYHYLPQVDSTNDLLKSQVLAGDDSSPPAGTVFLTDFQKKGRGRLNRGWKAPPESSLLFSVLFRPNWPPDRISWLTMISGLAVSEAVESHTGLTTRLKWPNDGVVFHHNDWHKFCGILQEGVLTAGSSLAHAVVGIGVNVNIPQERLPAADFPATSLLVASGHPVSRIGLFATLLSRLEVHYERAEKGHSPRTAWQERLIFMNERVVVKYSESEAQLSGNAIGTDEAGRLLIKDRYGEIHTIAAGDVTLRAYLES